MNAAYQHILEKSVIPKLVGLGFARVILAHCMQPEVLLRKGDLWFGTSWDYRDQYLELNIGGLYWINDVMPRVVVLGEYADVYPAIKRINPSGADFLEKIAAAVVESIADVVDREGKISESQARAVSKLRALLLGKVSDNQLNEYLA